MDIEVAMELDHLRTFQTVARTGSFTSAAELQHYAQSTVSVHIRTLEKNIGAPLFDRLPAGVRLTEAGSRLMPLAERMLDLASAASSVGQETEAVGELTVAAPETVVAHRLPAVLHHLQDRHPGLRVRLELMPYSEIQAAVSTGMLDVGFLFQSPLQSTSSLAIRPLRRERLVMVAGPEHPLAHPVSDIADEFSRATLFLTEQGCGYRTLLEGHLDHLGVRPGHTLEFDSVEAIRRCVETGLGIALIPEMWLTDQLRAGSIIPMDWFAPRFEVVIQLAVHPGRWQGPALRALIDASELCIGSNDEPAGPGSHLGTGSSPDMQRFSASGHAPAGRASQHLGLLPSDVGDAARADVAT